MAFTEPQVEAFGWESRPSRAALSPTRFQKQPSMLAVLVFSHGLIVIHLYSALAVVPLACNILPSLTSIVPGTGQIFLLFPPSDTGLPLFISNVWMKETVQLITGKQYTRNTGPQSAFLKMQTYILSQIILALLPKCV